MQPLPHQVVNISQAEHGGNGETVMVVTQSLRSRARRLTKPDFGSCCPKSPLILEMSGPHGILLTVRARRAFGSIAGSGIATMLEAVTAFFGVMSAGIFIAHAVDGYRSRF
jgi:hypothetical protein